MKQQLRIQQWLSSVVTAFALAGLAGTAWAGPTSESPDWLETFDATNSTSVWWQWWGVTADITWSAYNQTNNLGYNAAGSGSMEWQIPFVGAGGEQFNILCGFDYGWQWDNNLVLDGTLYNAMIFDIKVDPSTALGKDGTYGTLQVGLALCTPGTWNNQSFLPPEYYTIPASATNWTHVVLSYPPTVTGLPTVQGYDFDMWSNGNLTNTWTVYIDNVELQKTPTPPPPVTMGFSKVLAPGLQLTTTVADGEDPRQNIYSLKPASWYGATTPVTYSLTITNYPSSSYPYFQSQIELCNGEPWGPGDTSADWNSTNVVMVSIQNTPTGTEMYFAYKTNFPGGWGNQIFGTNVLCYITTTNSPVGTYSVTFTQNTNVLVQMPGFSTNVIFPAASAALFADPTYVYFGTQPNKANNTTNLSVTFANVKVSNAMDDLAIDDNFTDSNDLSSTNGVWGFAAADPAGMWIAPPGSGYYLNWSLPASGYTLQQSSDLANWYGLISAKTWNFNSVGWTILGQPLPGHNFFRSVKGTPQLQVLMPGETNAPNTVTGKGGSPTSECLQAGQFVVTVNLCDVNWNILTGATDTVLLTSNDPTSSAPVSSPSSGTLVGGTTQIYFNFGQTGTFTCTSTDVTNPGYPSSTSSPTASINCTTIRPIRPAGR